MNKKRIAYLDLGLPPAPKVHPTQPEIDRVLAEVAKVDDHAKSNYPTSSYEEGVRAGIEWILGRGPKPD